MEEVTMNKFVALIAAVGLATGACGTAGGTAAEPSNGPTTGPAASEPGAPTGVPFTFQNINLVVPDALDSDAEGTSVPRSDDPDRDWFNVAPEHSKITLSYGTGAAPVGSQIRVYPVAEMRQMDRADDIDRLRAALTNPALRSPEALPHVPFFNAAPIIAARAEVLDFHDGHGIRFLTEYAQDTVPIGNSGLFYHFQGLTSDEKHYVVAILPVGASILAANSDPNSEVPSGGVPFPGYRGEDALDAYFPEVTDALDAAGTDVFEPRLDVLDQLIESVEITS
jgi:hypothetical protein